MTGPCRHAAEPELGAYADEQLEGAARLWWDDHIRACDRCREEVARIRALGAALRASLPSSEPSSALRDAVRQLIRSPEAEPEMGHLTVTDQARPADGERRFRHGAGRRADPGNAAGSPVQARLAWSAIAPWRTAIAALLLVGVGFGIGRIGGAGASEGAIVADVVDAHVRALQVDHLVDVVSTDHHVVKPWFAGKLDFSPPVPDLAADSFPMLGGRTEYLDAHPVAALVYARGPHRINLFTWPAATSGPCDLAAPAVRLGFNVVHGRTAAMEFWAVSDLNPVELQAFASAWLREAGKSGGCPKPS